MLFRGAISFLVKKVKPKALRLLQDEVEAVVAELITADLSGEAKRNEAINRVTTKLKSLPTRTFRSLFPEGIPMSALNFFIEAAVMKFKSQQATETENSGTK
jgi:hypothetical protein